MTQLFGVTGQRGGEAPGTVGEEASQCGAGSMHQRC